MFDLVHEGRHDPSTKDTGHGRGDHDNSDLDRVVRESVESDLRRKCDDCLPDHAGDEQDYEVHGELSEHGEQLEREDGILGLGEVIPEAGDENDGPDGNCRGN